MSIDDDKVMKQLKESWTKMESKQPRTVELLNKIYRFVAVQGNMENKFGKWVKSMSKNHKTELLTFKEHKDFVLYIRGILNVKWDNGPEMGGRFKKGDEEDLENLWRELQQGDWK